MKNLPDHKIGGSHLQQFVVNISETIIKNKYLGDPVRVDLLYCRSRIVAFDRRCVLHRIRQLQTECHKLT